MKALSTIVISVVLAAAVFFGYINNIVILVQSFGDSLTVGLVLRLIGVVMTPLGVLMGYV